MKPVIVMPYRDEEGIRRRNWHTVRDRWYGLGYPLCPGDSPAGGPFDVTKARNAAVRNAIELVPNWDVALMIDADVFLADIRQAAKAARLACELHVYVAAHSEIRYLSAAGSMHVERGGTLSRAQVDEFNAQTWETVFAFTRVMWEAIGGFDSRFLGFGHQVEAFFHAAETLFGSARVQGPCYHLWHPYSADGENPQLPANRALVERYWAASGDKVSMHELLCEYAVE